MSAQEAHDLLNELLGDPARLAEYIQRMQDAMGILDDDDPVYDEEDEDEFDEEDTVSVAEEDSAAEDSDVSLQEESFSSDEDEDEDGGGGERCAICFKRCSVPVETYSEDITSSWRRKFVVLPCCGVGSDASTHFCASCIFHIATRPANQSPNEYMFLRNRNPVARTFFHCKTLAHARRAKFRRDEDNAGSGKDGGPVGMQLLTTAPHFTYHDCSVIECPRCRGLIQVRFGHSKRWILEDIPCPCHNCTLRAVRNRTPICGVPDAVLTAKKWEEGISLLKPDVTYLVNYAGRKDGMASILFAAAHMHRNFIVASFLTRYDDNAMKNIHKLCQWGILRPDKQAGIYTVGQEYQSYLLDLFKGQNGFCRTWSDFEKTKDIVGTSQSFRSFAACLTKDSVVKYLLRGKVWTGLRLFNQACFLHLAAVGIFPSQPLSPFQDVWVMFANCTMTVSVLIFLGTFGRFLIFFIAMALNVIVGAACYALFIFAVVLISGRITFFCTDGLKCKQDICAAGICVAALSGIGWIVRFLFRSDSLLLPSPARAEETSKAVIMGLLSCPIKLLEGILLLVMKCAGMIKSIIGAMGNDYIFNTLCVLSLFAYGCYHFVMDVRSMRAKNKKRRRKKKRR